jgi:hypothetical protein
MRAERHRFSAVRAATDVEILEADSRGLRCSRLDDLRCPAPFLPHSGWRGHIERNPQ